MRKNRPIPPWVIADIRRKSCKVNHMFHGYIPATREWVTGGQIQPKYNYSQLARGVVRATPGIITATKIDIIRRILQYEKIHGTKATANRFSSSNPVNEYFPTGDEGSMGQFENSRKGGMGNHFYDNGTPTAHGVMDLDWYTDLVMVSRHRNHLAPGATSFYPDWLAYKDTRRDYMSLKGIWNMLNK